MVKLSSCPQSLVVLWSKDRVSFQHYGKESAQEVIWCFFVFSAR